MNKETLLKHFEQALKENNTALINEISAILEQYNKPQFGSVSILDREHKTVAICVQEWMAVNLFCPELGFHYNNNPKNSEGGYGTLHSQHAEPAIQSLLPGKWRMSTDEDWDVLIKHVGTDAGRKLKSKTGWANSGNGTDEFGFGAVPAGHRYYNGSHFNYRGVSVRYWSSSVGSSAYVWYRDFYYNNAQVTRNLYYRSYGFSVRCVRDIK